MIYGIVVRLHDDGECEDLTVALVGVFRGQKRELSEILRLEEQQHWRYTQSILRLPISWGGVRGRKGVCKESLHKRRSYP